MNIELSTGLDYFWQWDTNTKLKIPDEIPEAHFRFDNKVATIEVEDGWVKIPDELMQKRQEIEVWTYDKEHTMDFGRIECRRRPKPDTYVYTPTEIKRWDDLDERIKALEKNNAAILYTEQELTEEQKAQARENIGAEGIYYGWVPHKYKYYYRNGSYKLSTTTTLWIQEGEINQIDYDSAPEEVQLAWESFMHISATGLGANENEISTSLNQILTLCNNGVFGDVPTDSRGKTITLGYFSKTTGEPPIFSCALSFLWRTNYLGVTWRSHRDGSFTGANMTISSKKIGSWDKKDAFLQAVGINNKVPALTQVLMSTAPTEDMHIATKKYVDDKTITPASDDSLELLAETGFIIPAHQDGVIYTAPTGEIYVI